MDILCKQCKDPISGRGKKFCSNLCQQEYQYRERVSEWLAGRNNGCSGKRKELSNHVKRYMFEINESKCQKCGWSEVNSVTKMIPLQVHHINGDYTDNRIENLELLCPNCHSLTSTFGSLNKNGRRTNGHF